MEPEQVTLAGRTALVTGGSRGIGLAAVRALAAAGARVTFTGRDGAAVAAALEGQGSAAGTVEGRVCDVTDRAGMERLAGTGGGFDILINNAGIIGPIGRIAEVAVADWARNIEVNLIAAFHAAQLAIRGMLQKGGGVIVNLSSGAAHRPLEGWSAYCAGKAGLAMLTRQIHEEYGGQGIRVFGFAPGVVDTDMQGAIRASGINPVSRIPRENLRPADEPGRAIAWLCTPAAAGLAGQELDIRDPALRAAVGLEALP
ncbi:MAG: SDR family oxidoreductase [Rhodobacteraceae bacterium]|nr:SDR family oxidoreductase [Paracoccaceae bacterium]